MTTDICLSENKVKKPWRVQQLSFEKSISILEGVYIYPWDLEKIVAEFQSSGKTNCEAYEINSEVADSEHRFADGGETDRRTFLKKDGKTVLASSYFKSYYTYGDDSEDYDYPDDKRIFLIENDPIAREIFVSLGGKLND